MTKQATTHERVSTVPDWYAPYAISQAIRVGDLVFVSGQAGIDENGSTVGDEFDSQAEQVFSNLERVLRAADSGLEHVVKVGIFVTDMAASIDKVVALRRRYFSEPLPADTLAEVRSLARPDWRIEIEAVATIPAERSA